MIRKLISSAVVLGFVAGVCLAAPAAAQVLPATPSLGAYARKQRAKRAQEKEKPAKVYTNDNIPKKGPLSNIEVQASMAKTSAQEETPPTAPAEGVHNEKYYREKLKELQDKKALHERELAVLQQRVGINQTQYFADPNKTLQQESTPAFRSDINKLNDQIAAKKKQIAEDQQAIDDLHQQCNREGCPPGWLR